MKKSITSPAVGLIGATLLGAGISASAVADSASFVINELQAGYQLAAAEKDAEGKCGEGKCGAEKTEAEGKCGAEKSDAEGKCGEEKAEAEGKCGEGKCGGDKQ